MNMKNFMLPMAFILAFIAMFGSVYADIDCSQTDASKTIALGEIGDIEVKCSGIGAGENVNVQGTFSTDCLDEEVSDSSSFSLTQESPSNQVSFEAMSMSCQGNIDDRKITWAFSHQSESIQNTYTTVSITSPLSITASFKDLSEVTAGASTTVILEVSTSATVDISDVDADMDADSLLGSSITDWEDNTIHSSGDQKTIQKSWTFTAPSTPGTYDIGAFVTSQNADSDSASVTLTVNAAGDDDDDDDSSPRSTGSSPLGALTVENKTKRPTIVPGIGLRNNTKLQAALEKVLGKGKMSRTARENMLRLSASISSDMTTTKKFNYDGVKSKVTTTMKYNGNKKIKNMALYESLPKTFASSATMVTVTAPGATVEIAEDDPSWVIVYPEIDPDEQITVNYEVTGMKSPDILDDAGTEIYAESLEDVDTAPGPAPSACTEGAKRCNGKNIEECDGTNWNVVTQCSGGCDDSDPNHIACVSMPTTPATVTQIPFLLYGGIALVIIIIIVALVYFLKMKKSGGTPVSALQSVKSDLGN